MYSSTTKNIRVSVKPLYLDGQSTPEEHHFVWAYHVRIENLSSETVQLMNRYWRITDGLGRVQEVRGAGVVGEQPVLQPGQIFEYTSGTPLPTPSGIMAGRYEMQSEEGARFEIEIPPFSLDLPDEKPRLN
jgi:ApaG protein